MLKQIYEGFYVRNICCENDNSTISENNGVGRRPVIGNLLARTELNNVGYEPSNLRLSVSALNLHSVSQNDDLTAVIAEPHQ